MLHAEEDAFEVDGLLTPPFLERHVEDAAPDADARVVHEHVQAAMAVDGVSDDLRPGCLVGHVVR